MEIKNYQTCPCQSGKKIKFCCGKSIISDLSRIVELNKSRQLVAALEHIHRTIARVGPIDCLVILKTSVMLHLKDYEGAKSVNDEFLSQRPESSAGHQHRALLLAAEQNWPETVQALQDAMDFLPFGGVPVSMASAFRIVGMMLVSNGQLVAGREHLLFSNRIAEEPAIGKMIAQTWRAVEVPLVLKRSFAVIASTNGEGQPWYDAYQNACRFANNGRWRAALQRLRLLDQQFPDQADILDGMAKLSMTLGMIGDGIEFFRRLAMTGEMSFDDRAELMALIVVMDRVPLSQNVDFRCLVFRLNDQGKFIESFTVHPQGSYGQAEPGQSTDDGPPPLGTGVILDRDKIRNLDDGDPVPESIPKTIADFFLYGKRTDREGRVELFLAGDRNFDTTIETFRKIAGDSIGELESESVVEQTSELDIAMESEWLFPRNMKQADRQAFLNRQREYDYLEVWTRIPMLPLSGKTPLEAAKGDEYLRSVLAGLLLIFEESADSVYWGSFDFDRLRDRLGVPLRQLVERMPESAGQLSPLAFQRTDFASQNDEVLLSCFVIALSTGNQRALGKCLPAILARPHLDKEVSFDRLYINLAIITRNNDEALEYLHLARQYAATHNRSVGMVLVMELDFRMQRDLPDGCQELLRTIESRYMQDPQVQYQLAMVLQKYGLIGDDRSVRSPQDSTDEPVGVAAEESGIWMPDSDKSRGGETSSSKLWIPD